MRDRLVHAELVVATVGRFDLQLMQ
jgi:hypothetical protein